MIDLCDIILRDQGFVFNFKYDGVGLIIVVVIDCVLGDVLMVVYMIDEVLVVIQVSGEVYFWFCSWVWLWKKGEMLGNVFCVVELWIDCDQDVVWVIVDVVGFVCYIGECSCFFCWIDGDWFVVVE